MSEAPIETIGVIREKRGEILYTVEAMNGKIVLGHLSKKLTDAAATFSPGEKVLLEMTPYDFDSGRISKKIEEGAAS